MQPHTEPCPPQTPGHLLSASLSKFDPGCGVVTKQYQFVKYVTVLTLVVFTRVQCRRRNELPKKRARMRHSHTRVAAVRIRTFISVAMLEGCMLWLL
jgi:hypothetical protein